LRVIISSLREGREMRKAISGIMLTLMLIGMFTLTFHVQLVKAELMELHYDDGEADAGVSMGANMTFGWGVKFDHPEVGVQYKIHSAKIYIYSVDGTEGILRLFVYVYSPAVFAYEKVYENIVNGLTQGWNVVDLTPYNIVTDQDFIIGVNWVKTMTPWLGDDYDTECHSGSFGVDETTIFWHQSGRNYMIRAYVTPTLIITASVDIHPQTLNLRSKGKWITAYIELPESYDVSNINVSTIMLNDTIPVEPKPIAIGDYDNDTVPDLMVKFDRQQVIKYIMANVDMSRLYEERFMTITLTVTGKLKTGTPFQGSDTVKIILPMPKCWRLLAKLGIYPF
jgi:hypothetical protein